MKSKIILSLLIFLMLGSCTTTADRGQLGDIEMDVPETTAAISASQTPADVKPNPTESDDIKGEDEIDFTELEGIKIYYLSNGSIKSIVLHCTGKPTNCGKSEMVISSNEISTFNQISFKSLSPDDDQLIFGSGDYSPGFSSDLFSYDLETGKTYRLTDNPDYVESGMLSPDGQKLAVLAHRTAGGHSFISIINPDGCCQQIIPNQGKFDKEPNWSPDGENIAFISGNRYEYHLFIYDLKNQEVVELVTDLTFQSTSRLFWSPDGRKIAVQARFKDDTDICIVDIEVNDFLCLEDDSYIEVLPSWLFDSSKII